MNCPSRNDNTERHPDWNQNPNALSADLTTRQDLNGLANLRRQTDHLIADPVAVNEATRKNEDNLPSEDRALDGGSKEKLDDFTDEDAHDPTALRSTPKASRNPSHHPSKAMLSTGVRSLTGATTKFTKFVGPGFLVAVAYMDPGNYATDVAAGSATRFQLLFVVLMSNLFALVLQALALRLGTVTGKNLAENCREHLPTWLNWTIYVFAESAVVATDVAEVIGSAIAINLLIPAIPLVAGCALTLADVLLILVFYRPDGGMRGLRPFEWFVMGLVLAVVVCFCIELGLIKNATAGEVFRGYVPSAAVVDGQGLYLSCGILGATVMPHSLFLGSGIVQPRLKQYDEKNGTRTELDESEHEQTDATCYRPSLAAIKHCLNYSTMELALSLCIFAFFINSAILIVSGASLSGDTAAEEADLFGVYGLLSRTLGPAAGILFAVALLFSGTSAGIVCTIAGQMISEGQMQWRLKPWVRRLITRGISITPSIIIAAVVGRDGLSAALTGSQVVLSVLLPFVSAPLLYFTCLNRYMTVRDGGARQTEGTAADAVQTVGMRNHIVVSILAGAIWLVITTMNVALLVFLGLGKD
jgi:metal iron transporter